MQLQYLAVLCALLLNVQSKNVVDFSRFGDAKISPDDTDLESRERKRVIGLQDNLQIKTPGEGDSLIDILRKRDEHDEEQGVLKHDIVIPANTEAFGGSEDVDYTVIKPKTSQLLATTLTQLPEVSVFASYIRDNIDLTNELGADLKSNQILIFAPTDTAIKELSKKPWEWPSEITETNNLKDETSTANINNFVESHVVVTSDKGLNLEEGANIGTAVLTTLNGQTINLFNSDRTFYISVDDQPKFPLRQIEVVSNGAVLIIDRALDWPERH
ncbi:hypothetical protein PP7435_CHR4-0694 [Komagataella phaffii CBS 7435]|uniref:FAS1 domain-containing protein n=2 Tax=Komagataella phaffii TaxID=460519 RepID=C4R7G7_KOMPG|nr:uncharacterized protein PAS_chr4_0303 [Komagataella phaffii GS115]AOA64731.1 GQ67_04636T0 [Komagataella phaffii]CAH2451084.1 hypothetical protein BQ9382_C4-3655 [Komagataella phaffii CBS 7435]AOA69770.1 GQ68_04608T0 [Komagataella phaffii GS115]CAY71542.1 Putative protein of unknown function [Komagataella phaffii GS115]CCA40851.1 hypothetical protein PP7435_CHR4-0694 [Komagataella phaffii CBS 7435]